jgi:hypothetical protein
MTTNQPRRFTRAKEARVRHAIEEATAVLEEVRARHAQREAKLLRGLLARMESWPSGLPPAFAADPVMPPEIEPRDPVGYAYGHPVEMLIIGTFLTVLSLLTILWIVSQRW